MANNIWIIDDDNSVRWVLTKALEAAHYHVSDFGDPLVALEEINHSKPDLIITDIRMPNLDGIGLLKRIEAIDSNLPVIIMTAYSDLNNTVTAYKHGVFDYVVKPFDIDHVTRLVSRALQQSQQVDPKLTRPTYSSEPKLLGVSSEMQNLFRAIGRLSRTNATVLICGESGSGKELVAQALHQHSPRRNQKFIAINTAAIPKDLLESELFGHERGAFTGAQSLRKGRFEQAHMGTLFLDEIGDMPAELQTRLLRVLAEGNFYRIGGHQPIHVNVRIIAATHQDLQLKVKNKQFREDLFHRLNVIQLQLPPLRHRPQDIPELLTYFLENTAKELNISCKRPNDALIKYLNSLSWPGNVRQLQNACYWLSVMPVSDEIGIEDLPEDLQPASQPVEQNMDPSSSWQAIINKWADTQLATKQGNILQSATNTVEKILIRWALRNTFGRRQQAANLLGLGRNTLSRKIKELDVKPSTDEVD